MPQSLQGEAMLQLVVDNGGHQNVRQLSWPCNVLIGMA